MGELEGLVVVLFEGHDGGYYNRVDGNSVGLGDVVGVNGLMCNWERFI